MSDRITVQYVGFEAKTLERVYIFSTLGAPDEPREFTLTILNEAFVSHRVSYQDAPNICSLKLHRELASQGDDPPKTHFDITDAELDEYRAAHSPATARKLYSTKSASQP
ncbi:MAG: hypothetical protein AUI53_02800 [Acidobacteria bacterium 13_1_40CM_2_60_7]|nr:MAG: hypothetical protein AUI53_02800 [Acidobacteria bacterium 13_1_40CM_2_60_7]OLE82978.1 MAG: hypothetical protein AUG07_09180 [Acidobacteria bacterium 13_1_20CM_2_60_10]